MIISNKQYNLYTTVFGSMLLFIIVIAYLLFLPDSKDISQEIDQNEFHSPVGLSFADYRQEEIIKVYGYSQSGDSLVFYYEWVCPK